MRILVRHIVKAGEVTEFRDEVVEANEVSIGKSLDQDIVLRGKGMGLQHAVFTRQRDGVAVKTNANNEVRVNDQPVKSRVLAQGDLITLGPHQLTLIPSPPGFDAAFELTSGQVSEEYGDYEAKFKTSLSQTGLGKRGLSWILAITGLLIGMGIPWVYSQWQFDQDSQIPRVITDSFWKSGPLVEGHRATMEERCTDCHETPFKMVRNTACDDCHKTISMHSAIDHELVTELNQRRCATCHKEHNEPGNIISGSNTSCAECHTNLQTRLSERETLQNVNDFDENHPDFTLTLLVENSDQRTVKQKPWIKKRDLKATESGKQLVEQSNLKFDHEVHLDPEGVDTPSDGPQVLKCADCHELNAAGESTIPVNMEKHCESCHRLSFDPRAGDFRLPHGSVEQVIYVMEGFYKGSQLVKPVKIASEDAPKRRRARRPGKGLQEMKDIDSNDPRKRMNNAVAEIFERTTCVICHEVSRENSSRIKWSIKPVRLNDDWMPKAIFDHQGHGFMKCTDCHEADKSKQSQDVLMPAIKTCRECHSDAGTHDKLASACIDCHQFHIAGNDSLFKSSTKIAKD